MAERLRPIAVDGYRFRWRFDGRLVVIPEGPQLYVEWGWRDWLEPVIHLDFVFSGILAVLGTGTIAIPLFRDPEMAKRLIFGLESQ